MSFVARYENGKRIPMGETRFSFRAGGLTFKSTGYEWLVVEADNGIAQCKGVAQVNGVVGYSFRLTAHDVAPTGVGSDGLGIRIERAGSVIYGNRGADSAGTQPIAGGNVVIHIPR